MRHSKELSLGNTFGRLWTHIHSLPLGVTPFICWLSLSLFLSPARHEFGGGEAGKDGYVMVVVFDLFLNLFFSSFFSFSFELESYDFWRSDLHLLQGGFAQYGSK